MSGRVNELLVDRVNKRQGNMVSGQVNEWTSEPVACYKEKYCCPVNLFHI